MLYLHNRVTVEDNAVFKTDFATTQWYAGCGYMDGFAVRIRDNGKFRTNRHIPVSRSLTLNENCVLAGGELWLGHPDINNITTYPATSVQPYVQLRFLGSAAVKGTEVHAGYLTARDGSSVLNLEAGKVVLISPENNALWTANGGYLNFTPYSSCEVLVTNEAVTVQTLYADWFAGENPRARYNGEPVGEGAFAELFTVADAEGGMVSLKLKPQTSDVILTDGLVAPGREYDNQWLKPMEYFRVVYPYEGATVRYSLDDGATWLEALPRLHDAGTYTITVKTSAEGLADKVETFTHVITPRDGSGFAASAPDVNYTGEEIVPAPVVADTLLFCGMLVAGRDYDLELKDNVDVGIATMTLKMKGNYKGEVTSTFRIIAPARSGDVYVNPNGGTSGDGSEEKPVGDLNSAVNLTLSDTVIHVGAGTYELDGPLLFFGKENITMEADGDGALVVPKAGCLTRAVSATDMTNLTFRNIRFVGFKQEVDALDETAWQGGAMRLANCTNVTLDACAFVSNTVQNTASTSAYVTRGGAVYAKECDLHFANCRFDRNWANNQKVATSYGGALYVDDSASAVSKLRFVLTMTNVTFRANCCSSAESGTTEQAYAMSFYLNGGAVDCYNCLFANSFSTFPKSGKNTVMVVGTGAFHRYTQCTFADNGGFCVMDKNSYLAWGVEPILIRSVVTGSHVAFHDEGNNPLRAVLVDSVYSGGGIAVTNGTTILGKSYNSSNWTRIDDPRVLERGYQVAAGTSAAAHDAGWRPASGAFGGDWYVDPEGDDTAAGTSAAPFRTLTKAVSVAQEGDVIHLAAGSYTPTAGEAFPIDFTGKLGVTVQGASTDATSIDGEGLAGQTMFTLDYSGSIRFYDLTIRNANVEATDTAVPSVAKALYAQGTLFDHVAFVSNVVTCTTKGKKTSGMFYVDRPGNMRFLNCTFEGNGQKMPAGGSNSSGDVIYSNFGYLLFQSCAFRNNGYFADGCTAAGTHDAAILYFKGQNADMTGAFDFRNCLFTGNGQQGGTVTSDPVLIYDNYTSPTRAVDFCTFADNPATVFGDSNSTGMKFYNSIFSGNHGVLRAACKVNGYNLLFTKDAAEDPSVGYFANAATLFDAGECKVGDPLFRNPAKGNYTLRREPSGHESPAVDAGVTRPWMLDDATQLSGQDLLGNPRKSAILSRKDPIPDMGCYELPRMNGFMLMVR